MPAERHSRPLHKVGPSFRNCQGGAHRRCGITSEQSAGARMRSIQRLVAATTHHCSSIQAP